MRLWELSRMLKQRQALTPQANLHHLFMTSVYNLTWDSEEDLTDISDM